MKIKVNYNYTQRYLPTRKHKNICEREVRDVISLNIKELIEDEFPIAFIVHDMQSVQDDMKSYRDYKSESCEFRMFSEKIRTYNGNFYKPLRITYGAAISTIFEDESYVIQNLERVTKANYQLKETKKFSENSIIIDDNSDDIKQTLRNSARNYIFYDGNFWSLCNEPRYVINTFGLGYNHGSTNLFIDYHYNPNISSKNYFNALQRDEAIAYGKYIAMNRSDTESIDRIGEYDNIEVLMPKTVKVNPNKQLGNGCEFMNMMENIISNSSSKNESGLLCLALTMNSTNKRL